MSIFRSWLISSYFKKINIPPTANQMISPGSLNVYYNIVKVGIVIHLFARYLLKYITGKSIMTVDEDFDNLNRTISINSCFLHSV